MKFRRNPNYRSATSERMRYLNLGSTLTSSLVSGKNKRCYAPLVFVSCPRSQPDYSALRSIPNNSSAGFSLRMEPEGQSTVRIASRKGRAETMTQSILK